MPPPTPGQRRSLLVATCLLTVLLGGCFGNGGDEASPADPPTAAAEPPPVAMHPDPQAPRVALAFPLAAPLHETYRIDGSFAPTDTGLGGGFVTGAFARTIDLTHMVPVDVPTRIGMTVTLNAAEVPVAGPTARADPVSNGTVWYVQEWQNPQPGRYELTGIVSRSADATLGVALEAYTPGRPDAPPEVAYSIEVNVTADPHGVPVGVPVAVPVDGNGTLTFETKRASQAELLVYGPDDRLVDRLFMVGNTTWTAPGSAGVFVVVPILGVGDLRILGEGNTTGEGALRALGLTRDAGPMHPIGLLDATSWQFDVERRPLRVSVTVLGPANEPWTCAGSLTVALHAPEGPLLQASSDCPSPTNVPFLYEERRTWTSHAGDARHVPGTYTVTVDNTLWSGHQAYQTVEHYTR